jgi:hypothetical protein
MENTICTIKYVLSINTIDDILAHTMNILTKLLIAQIDSFSMRYLEIKNEYCRDMYGIYAYCVNDEGSRNTSYHIYKRQKQYMCFDEDNLYHWNRISHTYSLISDIYKVDEFESKYGISFIELEYLLYYHKLLEARTRVYINIMYHDYKYEIYQCIKLRNQNKKIRLLGCRSYFDSYIPQIMQ